MFSTTRLTLFVLISTTLLLAGALMSVVQTQDTGASCAMLLEAFYTTASEACLGKPHGQVCNGGNPPIAEPSGPVSNSLAPVGALVSANIVTALTSTAFADDGSSGGLVWLRAEEKQLHALLVGDVVLRDVTPEGGEFPAWQSMIVQTGTTVSACDAAPSNTFVIQNALPGIITRVVVNGISIDLLGTAAIQTDENATFVTAIGGEIRVIAGGQTREMLAGQEVEVPHEPGDYSRVSGAPSALVPFHFNRVRNFPVELLDRPARLPQPGFVSTEGAVNLRAGPSTNYGVLGQVPAGTTMTILGRNPVGDWYHVRLPSGNTGWLFAELLRRNHGVITDIYTATPLPPQRYGNLGSVGRVVSPDGVNMRSAPDVSFAALFTLPQGQEVTLVARSPYNPWVKVDVGGIVGWVSLISLDTQVIIESLMVDYDVPPPPVPPTAPPPTAVPGSWGSAFPDPSCYPNCN